MTLNHVFSQNHLYDFLLSAFSQSVLLGVSFFFCLVFLFCQDDKGLNSKLGDYCSLSEVWKLWKNDGAFFFCGNFHFYVLSICLHTFTSLYHTHTHSQTDTHTAAKSQSSLLHLLIWGKLTFPHQDEKGKERQYQPPEKDKSYVGGPGVLCKNPKVVWAWIHTSWHVDTEGQRDWKGDPFTRMTAPPLLSPGSISFQHVFFFTLWGDMFGAFWVILTIIICKDEQHKDRQAARKTPPGAERWTLVVSSGILILLEHTPISRSLEQNSGNTNEGAVADSIIGTYSVTLVNWMQTILWRKTIRTMEIGKVL